MFKIKISLPCYRHFIYFILATVLSLYTGISQAGINTWTSKPVQGEAVSFNALALQAQADPQIFSANLGQGVFQSSLEQTNWLDINQTLPIFDITSLTISPTNPDNLLAGSQTQGLFIYDVSTFTWIISELTGVGVSKIIAAPPSEVDSFYAITGNGVFKSIDKGFSWDNVNQNLPIQALTSLAVDNTAVYVGTDAQGVFKTTDGGVIWQTTDQTINDKNVRVLSASPSFADIVYAGTATQGVFKTSDGGVIWQAVNNGLESLAITALAVQPDNSNVVFVATESGVFFSDDGGNTWLSQNTGLQGLIINELIVEFNQLALRAYAASNQGIFEFEQSGQTPDDIINQAPINQIPPTINNAIVDQSLAINGVTQAAFQVSDSDAGENSIEVTLSTTNGVLSVEASPTVTISPSAQQQSSITLGGSQTDINQVLLTLSYIAASSGAATIQISSNDLGNTGTDGAKQSTGQVDFEVQAAATIANLSIIPILSDQTISVGTLFTRQFSIEGGDGSPFSFTLVNPSPGMSLSSNGLLAWTAEQSGTVLVIIQVQQNERVAEQQFNIIVNQSTPTATDPADPVTILSISPAMSGQTITLILNDTLTQTFILNGSDGTPFSFSLLAGYADMSLSSQGDFSWQATTLGEVNVSIQATQGDRVAELNFIFSVVVVDENQPSTATLALDLNIISPVAPPTLLVNTPLSIQFGIAGNDGSPFNFSVLNNPAGMSISPEGHLTWQADIIGMVTPIIQVQQADRTIQLQFPINVTADNTISPDNNSSPDPIVTLSIEPFDNDQLNIPANGFLSQQINIQNSDGTHLFFDFINAPPGMDIDDKGVLSWQAQQPDRVFVHLYAQQAERFSDYQFNIIVTGDSPPILTAIDPVFVKPNSEVTFTATATSANNQALIFSLEEQPLGANIDPQTGLFQWHSDEAGEYRALVVVTDENGQEDYQQIVLIVAENNNIPPEFSRLGSLSMKPDLPFSFTVKATDQQSFIYLVDSPFDDLSIDETTGLLTWQTPISGDYVITVFAQENEAQTDNLSAEMQVLLHVDADVTSTGESSWSPHGHIPDGVIVTKLFYGENADKPLYLATTTGLYKSIDAGLNWTLLDQGLAKLSVQTMIIDYNHEDRLYVANAIGLFKSDNGGTSWQAHGQGLPAEKITVLKLDPVDTNTLYAGLSGTGQQRLFISHDGGNNWQARSIGLPADAQIKSLAINIYEPEQLLVGLQHRFKDQQKGATFKTFDAGLSWFPSAVGINSLNAVHDIQGHPDNIDVLYAATQKRLFGSQTGGFNWQSLSVGLKDRLINSVIIDAEYIDVVYVGTDQGVYRSVDGGLDWQKFNTNIENAQVVDLVFVIKPNTDTSTLYAVTAKQGLFILNNAEILPEQKDALEDYGFYAETLDSFDAAAFDALPDNAFRVINEEQLHNFPPELMDKLTATQLKNMDEAALHGLSVEQYRHIPDSELSGLVGNNIGGLPPHILDIMTREELSNLTDTELQNADPDDLSYFLTNLDGDKINPEDVDQFLPAGWEIDAEGDLRAPPNTLLRFDLIDDLENFSADIDLPDLPDLSRHFALGGKGNGLTLLQELNTGLDADDEFQQTQFTQTDQGILELDHKQAFIPDIDTMRQAPDDAQPGVAPASDGSGRLVVTTKDKKQFTLNPAPKNLLEAQQILKQALSGFTIKLRLGKNGDVLIEGELPSPAGRRASRSRVHRVTVFDPDIEDAPEGVTAGIRQNKKGETILVYADKTAQKIHPAILSPNQFKQVALAIPGLSQAIVNVDGTASIVFAGKGYKLIPTFDTHSRSLGKGETFKPKITIETKRGKLGLRYSVVSNKQVIHTRLLIQ